MISFECDDLTPNPRLPRPYILETSLSPSLVICLPALLTFPPLPRSIERSHNDTNLIFTVVSCEESEPRRIELSSIPFHLSLSLSILTLPSKLLGI